MARNRHTAHYARRLGRSQAELNTYKGGCEHQHGRACVAYAALGRMPQPLRPEDLEGRPQPLRPGAKFTIRLCSPSPGGIEGCRPVTLRGNDHLWSALFRKFARLCPRIAASTTTAHILSRVAYSIKHHTLHNVSPQTPSHLP